MTSPADRYATWQASRRDGGALESFTARFDFDLDPFQLEAARALSEDRSVLVAAPTGAGKTVVGEFAIHLALLRGHKVFYTAPIKALSNQKFGELVDWLGAERVGLLTGDTSVRPDAEVVVMTTEVLRNMLYADSPLLEGLGFVVMDEVHYLADRLRGPVWEEVILHLAPTVRLVALSATVSNAEEFGAWLQEVRGDTEIVVTEQRPVPLWQHLVVGDDLMDLFVDEQGEPVVALGPGASSHARVNPEIQRAVSFSLPVPDRGRGSHRDDDRGGRGRGRGRGTSGRHRPRGRSGRRGRHHEEQQLHGSDRSLRDARGARGGDRGGRSMRPLRRPDLLRLLDAAALLPAIVFIFSRAGCEGAVAQCDRAGLRLTTPAEQRRIRAVLDERLAAIGYEDEKVLGLDDFRHTLMHGYAAHHAGMIPLLKTIVEDLFAEGLLKAVFATETLALGINMPARSVVLEKLVKFNGIEHADLTPGEFTQLTGRAGRRGIDTEGHAVVLGGPRVDAQAVASLASRRTYPLRSAFRPTANMAVNLLETWSTDKAREVLETSFAQFQADRAVVGLARRARDAERTVEDYRAAITCEHGDLPEYADLLERIRRREKELSRARADRDRDRTRTVLRRLRRGDVLAMPGGKRNGYGVVLDVQRDVIGGPLVQVLGIDGRRRDVRPADLPSPPAVIDDMKLPRPDRMGAAKVRRDTASALRQRLAGHDDDPRREVRRRVEKTASTASTDEVLLGLKDELSRHPCAQCPDLQAHLRWVDRWRRAERDLEKLRRTIDGRTSTLARAFDRLCGLLVELGHLAPDDTGDLAPTEKGRRLRRIFHDRDLLVAECLDRELWTELDPAGLAAIVSATVHEARREEVGAPEVPEDRPFLRALERTLRTAEELEHAQRVHGVDVTSPPDAAVSAAVHRWASGRHFAAALEDCPLGPGDFVRHCRQVIDMLDQLTADPSIGHTAHLAVQAVRRGLVAQEIDR